MPQTIERLEAVTPEDLERFSAPQESTCVSIFIPTHRAGQEVQQDPIRLKNAVSTARQQLIDFGLSEGDATSLLEPAADLVELGAADDFWQHQSDGLGILLSRETASLFQLTTSVSEHVAVSHRFHVKPLIRSANGNEDFHLVACSRNDVRVFRGSRNGLVEESFPDLPSGIEDVTANDQQRGHNRHSFRVRARSADSSVPHGHVEHKEEADLQQYFREIKDAIGDHLRSHSDPVVFAGVKELLPYFRKEFDCCTVLDEPASGNADHLSESDLLSKAWPLVEEFHAAELATHVNRLHEASGTDFGSTDLSTIVQAAFAGRIDTLFLTNGVSNHGACDDNGMVTRSGEEASAETYDLHDVAAIRTLRADGRVVFVTSEQGVESPIAAIFRYVA